jgi:hypothetical protein
MSGSIIKPLPIQGGIVNYTAPSVTPAQVIAGISSVVGLLVANLWISSHVAKEITDIAAVVVPAVFMIADAYIRAAHIHAAASVHAVTGQAAPTIKR